MEPLLSSPAVRIAAASLVTVASTGALSWLTRRWGSGRWATLTALLLGGDPSACNEPAKGDLRFAAVVASITAGLAWVIALEEPIRELSPGARATALAAGVPLVALAVSALADLLSWSEEPETDEEPDLADRASEVALKAGFTSGQSEVIGTAVRAGEAAYGVAATVVGNERVQAVAGAAAQAAYRGGKTVLGAAVSAVSGVVAEHLNPGPGARRQELRALLEDARAAVATARARAVDTSAREAADSLGEALSRYAEVLEEDGADLDLVGTRIREVLALARSSDEGADDFRALGLTREATLDDARKVYRELARIYHADAGLRGVDADKFKEIAAAYERVRAYLEQKAAA
jgi:hypothetical protein